MAHDVPIGRLCDSLGVARSAVYRKPADIRAEAEAEKVKRVPANALTKEESMAIRERLNSAEYADQAIPQVYADLLEKGEYLGSPSTMYRVMREHGEVRERRDQRLATPPRPAPLLCVRRPNFLWSWDITKLVGIGVFYCLYVILDVFSRYVVGWMVAERQSSQLAAEVIIESMRRQRLLGANDTPAHALALLSDNGGPMIGKPLATLMDDLDVRRVYARPHTPNDNAYSESQFRTMKYRPDYPDRFASLLHARGWGQTFFDWYNNVHYHSGLGMLTPATVHFDRVEQSLARRRAALVLAFNKNPIRFCYQMPILAEPPSEVWINKPTEIPGLIRTSDFTKL